VFTIDTEQVSILSLMLILGKAGALCLRSFHFKSSGLRTKVLKINFPAMVCMTSQMIYNCTKLWMLIFNQSFR